MTVNKGIGNALKKNANYNEGDIGQSKGIRK
jgi:hypothetical protein